MWQLATKLIYKGQQLFYIPRTLNLKIKSKKKKPEKTSMKTKHKILKNMANKAYDDFKKNNIILPKYIK